jgi:anti-sigma regulatory factor (Ser/Thr protein kinase)
VEVTSSHGESIVVILDESTKVGEARRLAASLAGQLGFDETTQGKVALIVTEAASNLIKHGGGGQLVVHGLEYGQAGRRIEILALDTGRGMSDVGRCMADGYSTAGSPGTGLGAISRIADAWEIYSNPGVGTVLWARLDQTARPRAERGPGPEVGVVRLSAPGEQVCGDAWAMSERHGMSFLLMVDGLGHGSPAAHAAQEALRVFRGHRALEPAEILESTHSALRSTRGAALAIARLDEVRCEVRYAGVGNISGMIVNAATGQTTNMISHNGTVGYMIRKIHAYDYPWTDDSLLLMHSDGLATRWNIERYPGVCQRHPSVLAGILYRDHKRGRDDVTVLVAGPGRAKRS